jgi:hypothetical protein
MERADNFKKVLEAVFGGSTPDLPVPDDSASGNQNDQDPWEGSDGNAPSNSSGSSDTSSGGSSNGSSPGSAWYPDYNPIWADGKCINHGEPPSGRPNYPSLEECCSKSYGGQESGVCLGSVQDSPSVGNDETDNASGENVSTTSSTSSAAGSTVQNNDSSSSNSEHTTDETSPHSNNENSSESSTAAFWPDYNPIWSLGKCVSDGDPPSGRPNYPSLEECCNNAYGGQASNVCIGAALEGSASESSAPQENGASSGDMWYPDCNSLWSMGKCTNTLPFENGRPTYSTQMECCQNAYRGQASGVCLADIPDQPTSVLDAVENSLEMWYGDYNPIWAEGKCIKTSPIPDNRPWYYSQSECCEKTYGGQASGVCLGSIEAGGAFADAFTSFLQSQRLGELLVYSCDSAEIPSSSSPVDVSYDYEFSVPKSIRADLVFADVKRRIMDHIASEIDCKSTVVPRKLRTQESGIVGLQSSSLSDEIDTKKARCREPLDASFVCVPVIGHLVVFVDDGASPTDIEQAKNRILKNIAAGQYTSESIRDVVFIGEHSSESPSIQIQSESASSTVWVPIVVSLFIIAAVVSIGLYVVIKRRRLMRIQEQSDEGQDCSEKIVMDRTTRMSEYSLPTSAGDIVDDNGDDECSSASGPSEQLSESDIEDSINNDTESDDGSMSLNGYDAHDEGSASL